MAEFLLYLLLATQQGGGTEQKKTWSNRWQTFQVVPGDWNASIGFISRIFSWISQFVQHLSWEFLWLVENMILVATPVRNQCEGNTSVRWLAHVVRKNQQKTQETFQHEVPTTSTEVAVNSRSSDSRWFVDTCQRAKTKKRIYQEHHSALIFLYLLKIIDIWTSVKHHWEIPKRTER